MKKFLWSFSPDCREAVQLQSQSLDAKLTWHQFLGLKLHLFLCKWCRDYVKQVGFLGLAARKLCGGSSPKPSVKLPADARERIKNSLNC